jgi:hypothetical protein
MEPKNIINWGLLFRNNSKKIIAVILVLLFNISLYAQYPTATSANINYEHITNFSFSNLDNSSTDLDDDGDTYASYNYYDDTLAYVNTGKTYTISVSIYPDPASPNENVSVFIDWNKDNDFTDAGENITIATGVSTAGPHTVNITVPTGASTGITRMRVVLSWSSAPPSGGTAPNYGEVEDYNISISRYNYAYLGSWNSLGLPDYLTTPSDLVTAGTLALINNVLPDGQPNLDYIDYNDYLNIELDTTTKVWASFIYEAAGYQNTFAMYNYPSSNPPSTAADIDSLTIIFPNASGTGSGSEGGGALNSGAKVFYGEYPSGVSVGFAIISNGYGGAHTSTSIDNQGNAIHYSNNNLNSESDNSLKAHNVTFWDSNQEKYILGFEDMDREASGCDHDFNDVLFYISVDPIPDFEDTSSSGGSNQQPPDIENPDETPLPVEWLKLESNTIENQVYLYWYIASQQNNKEFVVERSEDLLNFEEIGLIKGHGTTNQLIRYTYVDDNPLFGTAYYRIKQIDYDGKSDYSELISVYFGKEIYFALYPNPLSSETLNIRAEGFSGEIEISVFNSQSQLVLQENFAARGNFTKAINTEKLSNGVYYISIRNNKNKLTKKLVINR